MADLAKNEKTRFKEKSPCEPSETMKKLLDQHKRIVREALESVEGGKDEVD